jgi:hypothetical protein
MSKKTSSQPKPLTGLERYRVAKRNLEGLGFSIVIIGVLLVYAGLSITDHTGPVLILPTMLICIAVVCFAIGALLVVFAFEGITTVGGAINYYLDCHPYRRNDIDIKASRWDIDQQAFIIQLKDGKKGIVSAGFFW